MIEYDEIGLIPDILGEYDLSGNEIVATTYKVGWHVNCLELVSEWSAYLLDPQPVTPYRIYAGGVPFYAYQFQDQATFDLIKDV